MDTRAPASAQEAVADRNRELAEKLQALEKELHDLNVQLIREELDGDST